MSDLNLKNLSESQLIAAAVELFLRKKPEHQFSNSIWKSDGALPIFSYLQSIFEHASDSEFSSILNVSRRSISGVRSKLNDSGKKQKILETAREQLKTHAPARERDGNISIPSGVLIEGDDGSLEVVPNPLATDAHGNQALTVEGKEMFLKTAYLCRNASVLHNTMNQMLEKHPELCQSYPCQLSLSTVHRYLRQYGLTTKIAETRFPRKADPSIFLRLLRECHSSNLGLLAMDETTIDPSKCFDNTVISARGVPKSAIKSSRFEPINIIAVLNTKFGILHYEFYFNGKAPVDHFMSGLLEIIKLRDLQEPFVVTDVCQQHASSSLKWRSLYSENSIPIYFIPTSSPHFNPIENFWAVLKKGIKKKWTSAFLLRLNELNAQGTNTPTAKYFKNTFYDTVISVMSDYALRPAYGALIEKIYPVIDGQVRCCYEDTVQTDRGGSKIAELEYQALKIIDKT